MSGISTSQSLAAEKLRHNIRCVLSGNATLNDPRLKHSMTYKDSYLLQTKHARDTSLS